METIAIVTEALKTGGAWSLVAILLLVVRHLYLGKERDYERHSREKQELNDRLISMTVRQVEVLTQNTENQKQLIEAVRLFGG
jgi:hypothetical protein